MHILVIHGPNLNMLGRRDASKYGTITLPEINRRLSEIARELEVGVRFFQSNHEGAIIDFLQTEDSRAAAGVLVNPGALIRYAYSFRQALVDLDKPVWEVHMSDIGRTGVNKKVNVLDDVRVGTTTGRKAFSYYDGLHHLVTYIRGTGDAAGN